MSPFQESFCRLVRLSFGTAFEDADPRRLHGLARMGRFSGITSDTLREILLDAGASEGETLLAIDVAFRIPEKELRAKIADILTTSQPMIDAGDGKNPDANGVDDGDRVVIAMIRLIGED